MKILINDDECSSTITARYRFPGRLLYPALGGALDNIMGDPEKGLVSGQTESKLDDSLKGKRCFIILSPNTGDRGYRAECPQLPGCASQGETVEKALEMIKVAIRRHLEVCKNRGRPRATQEEKGQSSYRFSSRKR